MAIPIKWENANFLWNANLYTWDEVALVEEVAKIIRAGGDEEWNQREKNKKKKLVKLKGYFETGDIPNQNQYGELIDSNLNLVETGIQITAGQISSSALLSETFISASGDISSKGNISSSGLIVGHPNSAYVSASAGSGSAQGNVWVSGTGSFGMIKVSTIQGNSPIIVKDITTFQSTLSASGDLYVSGNVAFTDSTAANVIATGYISGSVISSSGNIGATGKITAGDYELDGVYLTTTFTELNYLDGLTSGEATQIKNIGSNAISSAEWGYVAGGQAHGTSNSPTFANLTLSTHHELGQIRF
jgi:hypothetical protein